MLRPPPLEPILDPVNHSGGDSAVGRGRRASSEAAAGCAALISGRRGHTKERIRRGIYGRAAADSFQLLYYYCRRRS